MDASALFKFSSGLYVVSADPGAGERAAACLVNTGLQVTSAPLQVSVTVNKENFTCGAIERAGHFSLAVVDESADMLFVGRFGFRTSADFDKYDGIASAVASTGDPYPAEHVCSYGLLLRGLQRRADRRRGHAPHLCGRGRGRGQPLGRASHDVRVLSHNPQRQNAAEGIVLRCGYKLG